MGLLDIGIENLPNVYIDKVVVRVLDNGDRNIEVTCLMKDHREEKSWYLRPDLALMKVKVAMVHDGLQNYVNIVDLLNNGNASLFNLTSQEVAPFFIKGANQFSSIFGQSGDEDSFYYATFKFDGVPPDISNVVVYAACFVDGFGFENDLFNKYYGPMSSEVVYANGSLNTLSSYFYFPDTNEVYGGPVHQHAGGYMEGSQHRDQPHRALVLVPESNVKLSVVNSTSTQAELDPRTTPAPFIDVLTDDDLVGGGGVNRPPNVTNIETDLTPGNLGQNQADNSGVGY